MTLFHHFFPVYVPDTTLSSVSSDFSIDDSGFNPANGLPMIGAVDIEGNLFGCDSSHSSPFASDSPLYGSGSGFDWD